MAAASKTLTLSGGGLSTEDLARAARDPSVRIAVDPAGLARVRKRRAAIDRIVRAYRAAGPADRQRHLIYGVTTGFGEFKSIAIAPEDLIALQRNILLSHSAGVGDTADGLDPSNYFPAEVVRATMIVRLNAFLRGHSGVRPELALIVLLMINTGVVPLVPTKGSLGSSGDLCPLSHLFAVLLGEGHFYITGKRASPAGVRGRRWMIAGQSVTLLPASTLWDVLRASPSAGAFRDALRVVQQQPVVEKEGLALTNGANVSAAMLALAVEDAQTLANTADTAAALTMESSCARLPFLDPRVHDARGMTGQKESAANMRRLIEGTNLCEWADSVQDAYSIRCAPQVHGASRDAIAYAKMVATAEINAATDNPLFFDGGEPFGVALRRSRPLQSGRPVDTRAFSAGNFHGQPVAVASDCLAIAVAEFANIAERRVQMMLDSHHNRHLPPNLIAIPGLHSGFMIAQYSAASLVSENKVLTHPASTDSIPTSSNTEDHVAMATLAARKARQVIENTSAVLAVELIVAAQAADWRTCLVDARCSRTDRARAFAIDPNLRSEDEPSPADAAGVRARAQQRFDAFSTQKGPGPSNRTMQSLGAGTRAAYRAIRTGVPPMQKDVVLEPMIRSVRAKVLNGDIVKAVNAALVARGARGARTLASIRALS